MTDYICSSWQYFTQRIISNVNKGYIYYCIINIKNEKMNKVLSIDQKLISKYYMNCSKDQRYRRKGKGIANFLYLRYENLAIIMHTKGQIEDVKVYGNDNFVDVNVKPIILSIGQSTKIEIRKRKIKGSSTNHYTVSLSQGTIHHLTLYYDDLIKKNKIEYLKKEFNNLNNLPAYSGIIDQKATLKSHILRFAKRKQININPKELKIRTHRKIYRNNNDSSSVA